MLLDWLRPSEVMLTGGRWGKGAIRGGPYQDDVWADITSGFDPNRPPVTVNGVTGPYGHLAVDMSAGAGAPILCVGGGVVFGVQIADGRLSNSLFVNHENGWMSVYAHMLNPPAFQIGDRIASGQVIGVEDTTGVATGPHLHFELRWNNVAMDPVTALLIGPDFPTSPPIPQPQTGDPSPVLHITTIQQLQHVLGNGTVVFPGQFTPAQGNEGYTSIKDGIPRTLTAGQMTRGYTIYVPWQDVP